METGACDVNPKAIVPQSRSGQQQPAPASVFYTPEQQHGEASFWEELE
jgi:hypothetical protein